ncbi:50S ribosomal protein L18 [Candidatus Woesearchaeota archaeon]|nr:50S ribosomal protein L18 [Candidatus Woesearchaeota archaeon]
MDKNVSYRRKREGKTDYKNRLSLLKSRKPRLIIRKSLRNVQLQLATYNKQGDKVMVSSHSNQLKKFGWASHKGNLQAAYLTGLMLGLKAKSKNVKEAVLDLGLARSVKGSVLYAALKGAIDSGLNVPHSKDIIPEEKKIAGKDGFKETKEKILKEKW